MKNEQGLGMQKCDRRTSVEEQNILPFAWDAFCKGGKNKQGSIRQQAVVELKRRVNATCRQVKKNQNSSIIS